MEISASSQFNIMLEMDYYITINDSMSNEIALDYRLSF